MLQTITEFILCDVGDDSECANYVCHAEIQEFQREISEYKQKVEESKNQYHEALVLNLKKDMKLEQLQKTLQKSQYDEFRGIISDDAIIKLNSIDYSVKKDSIFILTAVKDLYRNDLARLKQITFSGRRNKNPMTPEKKKVLSDLLKKRMANNPDDSRINNLGKYVKTSIESIVSTLK